MIRFRPATLPPALVVDNALGGGHVVVDTPPAVVDTHAPKRARRLEASPRSDRGCMATGDETPAEAAPPSREAGKRKPRSADRHKVPRTDYYREQKRRRRAAIKGAK